MNREENQGSRFGRGAYAFFADNTLHIGAQMFDSRFNEAVILYGGVGLADVWTVNTQNVVRRLDSDDGTELLRQGLVFVLRRNTAPSFVEMFNGLLAKGTHAVSEGQRGYVERLNVTAAATAMTWAFSDVQAAYIAASNVLLTAETLQAITLTPEGAHLIAGEYAAAKVAYHNCIDEGLANELNPYTNTWVFDRVSERGSKRLKGLSVDDGNKAWLAARTMYMFNIPSLLELGVAAQDGFDGMTVLRALRLRTKPSADLLVTRASVTSEGAFRAALGDPRVAWLFSPEVISCLTAEELTAATRVEYAVEYHAARSAFLSTPSEANWLVLVGAMKTYLVNAASEIIRLRVRANTFRDPVDADVHLLGDAGSLRMESTMGGGVQMTGLPANFHSDPVQIVAQHVEVLNLR